MSTRAAPRCVRCSNETGQVVLRRGHGQCPLASGGASTASPPPIPSSVTAMVEPPVSVADVHPFDFGAIFDFGTASAVPPLEDFLFPFPNLDIDGPIDPPPPSHSPDSVISWSIEPPPDPVNPQSPLEFTSENIFRYLSEYNADTTDNANLDIEDTPAALSPNLVTSLGDSVLQLALDPGHHDESAVVDESTEATLGIKSSTIPVLATEQPGLHTPSLAAKKSSQMNPALLTKVSKIRRKSRRKDRNYSFIENPKTRSKLYSKITNDIIDLVDELYTRTHCYGAIVFAGIDSIPLRRTKVFFTPNLTTSDEACATLEGYSEDLGNLMVTDWHSSQIAHNLQVNRWRSDAAESTINQ